MVEENREPEGGASSSSPNPLYIAALVVGLILAIYIYLIKFDDFSETQLMQLSPLWFLAVVFGVMGLLGDRAQQLVREGKAEDMAQGVSMAARSSLLARGLILLPSIIFNPARLAKTPLGIAAICTAFWAVLLYAFFLFIFPSL